MALVSVSVPGKWWDGSPKGEKAQAESAPSQASLNCFFCLYCSVLYFISIDEHCNSMLSTFPSRETHANGSSYLSGEWCAQHLEQGTLRHTCAANSWVPVSFWAGGQSCWGHISNLWGALIVNVLSHCSYHNNLHPPPPSQFRSSYCNCACLVFDYEDCHFRLESACLISAEH